MDQAEKIIQLLIKRLTDNLTQEEEIFIKAWKSENPDLREALLKRLSDPDLLGEYWRKRSLVDVTSPMADMKERLGIADKRRKAWKLATAGLAATALAGVCFWFADTYISTDLTTTIPNQQVAQTLSIDSLHPGETVAFINTGGEKIAVGETVSPQGTPVAELRGKMAKKGPIILEVPKGGEFIVVLEDSTKVWLNSATTLTYPETFSSDDRRVEVIGEAYFAVSKDQAGKPFYVTTSGQEVCVYGTEFNIRSYPEEEAVFTSLKSGSVGLRRVDGAGGELKLSPGRQAVFNKHTQEASVRSVDIETVTGWRHGRFVFQDQTLKQIMYDLGRWYDFEFEFSDPELENIVFMGSIPRYSDFSTAMLILEKTGGISFAVRDNKVIVSHEKLK